MRTLLLNPPVVDNIDIVREGRCMQRQEAWGTSWAPLTLALMAAILRDAGFTVRVKDCPTEKISFEKLIQEIRDFRPSLIVVNTSTPSIKGDLSVAKLVKDIDSSIVTVFIGIHVTALPEKCFEENPEVDFIVSGEPEYTVRDLAIALKDGDTIEGVKGLVYKAGGKIVYNERRPFIENLDEFPYPAWDLVNVNNYRLPITNRPFLLVLTGRGCPYPCTFCAAGAFYGKRTRLKSWRRVVDEIKFVRKRYGVNDFLFWSENSIAEKDQIYQISNALAQEVPGVKWVCNGRADMVDRELLAAMKKGGCWMVGYGIEAGTQRVLDMMKKNIRIRQIEDAVKLTKEAGIEVTGHVIVGYPGESKEDILETKRLLKRLDLDYIQVYCSVPFPGSRLYEEARNSNVLESAEWARFEQNFSILNTPHLSAKEAMSLREDIIRDFYLNPRKILKAFFKLRSPQEVFFLASFALRYFTSWVPKDGVGKKIS